MARSLAPLTVLILVMVWLYSPSEADPVREIDPAPTLEYAESIADFEVLTAGDLPPGWRPTSARVEPLTDGGPVVVTVGFVTPSQQFAEVVHGSVQEEQLLLDVLGESATETGEISLDGGTWRDLLTADSEQALVRSTTDSTVIVTGSADSDELRVLAAALRPVGG